MQLSIQSVIGALASPNQRRVFPKPEREQHGKGHTQSVIDAIHGKVGDLVFKRWEDQEIVTKMPDRTGIVPTADQLDQMNKFRLAALYGKAVMADDRTRVDLRGRSAPQGYPRLRADRSATS